MKPVPSTRAGGRTRLLGTSIGLGALYDLAFALVILTVPQTAGRWLGVPVPARTPADRVYLDMVAVLLILVAALYGLAWRDPLRYRGIIAVAAAGRTLGFVFLLAAWASGAGRGFLALALGDLAFAVLHGALLGATRSRVS